ncbi:putative MFS transporter [Actinoplanes missouriensis 431]|uniref:Putative MFS transporter n=1 Tax=Actinoplanes missouriensis (strain ATCC 14538 / DSM 43046 / CBS 188.64 / JCM 3121 / NBRC 102363 / NCIMB 12654 / NRRL B-3342 / UNCC 431) TaxID=512565 RepID=I0HE17_ACTM4|nr:MFS transporter [Actinoplanes missouriensis]BAL91254.1 putative MFS transporter [Actinoplanes missouriensis 431]
MQTMPTDRATIRARWAITTVFGANGLLIASLAVRTPSLKIDLDLTPGQLGTLSALFGVAAVIAMQTVGTLVARTGSRTIVQVTTVTLPLLLIGIGAAPNLWTQMLVQIAFGAVHGMLDVTMNAHAVAVERRLGRPIMNTCHAAWSIGSVAGALLGAGAAQIGTSRTVHYVLLTCLLIPLAVVCSQALLPASADRSSPVPAGSGEAGKTRQTGWRTGWSLPVVMFGVMGGIVLTVEAAVADWSGVYLHEDLSASLGAAGLGYVMFAALQTAGRLVGDRLQERTSATLLLQVGTATAAAGVAIAVLSPWVPLSVAGFAITGIGLATPLPVLFGVVGHLGAGRGDDAGAAAMVARFTTLTYTGILFAPAAIGWFADHFGLQRTLAALVPLLLVVAATAGPATRSRRPADEVARADAG